ncbi:hypothetical protein DSCO28_15790 [Desulfosarcina ovata subsp. sediminis]|uniref:VWFA domain-containing protein n=1 Tax=Desulfosarcina ovata subsp. sediminis TaxID=885957 RepID=A0A5K7ZRB2_9BACT|nr:vWA domain-containing protein [Desulfosarcina ovata]BBO81013.1 hypothetical protein DSCO28_15790 [Desulfosarcina ovata subsp. sediminis]
MALERIELGRQHGYSSYWRRDTSPSEMIEMTTMMTRIRDIAGYVGRNVGEIVWGDTDDEAVITIDPTIVMGRYPVPSRKVDIAVGQAIHKSIQRREWSQWLLRGQANRMGFSSSDRSKFLMLVDSAEKIYADLLARKSILGLYTDAHRRWAIRQQRKGFTRPPSVEELLSIWWEAALARPTVAVGCDGRFGRSFESVAGVYRKPLALLLHLSADLEAKPGRIPHVFERVGFRRSLYTSAWNLLKKRLRTWPADATDPFFFGPMDPDAKKHPPEGPVPERSRNDRFLNRVNKTVNSHGNDYTAAIKSVACNGEAVVRVKRNRRMMPAEDQTDKNILFHLKSIFQSVSRRQTSCVRGLSAGRIDRRRLYRASTTGRVFLQKKTSFELKSDFVLLVDCSGSMADPGKWHQTQIVYQTLHSAIRHFNRTARLFGYNEMRGICRISELFCGGQYHTVSPNGKTASGEAIMATVMTVTEKQSRKRPFIVHITDGASNWGCGVGDAVRFCEQKNVRLLTLGIACSPDNAKMLKHQYGRKVEFAENLKALPVLIQNLLQTSRQP